MTETLFLFLGMLLGAAIFGAVVYFAMKDAMKTKRTEPKEPALEKPEEKLPMKVCRKARPTIEEQIINMALYNGEDQTGGDEE